MKTANDRRPGSGRALLTALDREILRHALRHGVLRRAHMPALTGASPWTVKERSALLARRGLLVASTREATLRDGPTVSNSSVRVWEATPAGARLVARWTVPGTAATVRLTPRDWRASPATTDDLLAAADLSAWYGTHGYRTLTWLEAEAVDHDNTVDGDWTTDPWSVALPDGSEHTPLVGAVAPSGDRWWVDVAWPWVRRDWSSFIGACDAGGHSLVIHCVGLGAVHPVLRSCEALGLTTTGGPKVPGVVMVAGGRVRIARWLPGPAGLRGPETWQSLLPAAPPAGLPSWPTVLQKPWRGRRLPIDVGAEREWLTAG